MGPWRIGWYALMLCLGFLAGNWTARRRAPLAGVPVAWFTDIFVIIFVAALVGSRLWHVLESWDEKFRAAPWWEIFAFSKGGLTYYGGFFGAVAAMFFYARWRRVSFWKLADVITPSIALGYAITRIGCLMNGCCWGCPTSVPWAITFPATHPTHAVPVHPTQLYNSAANLALYAGLEWIFRRRRFEGQVLGCYLAAYGAVRFVTESFRGDNAQIIGGVLTLSQATSIALLVGGVLFLSWRKHNSPAIDQTTPAIKHN